MHESIISWKQMKRNQPHTHNIKCPFELDILTQSNNYKKESFQSKFRYFCGQLYNTNSQTNVQQYF